jgi:REP element-mobilizing transposase RayT
MADHVHLLFVLGRTISLSKAVEELKKESSKWAKDTVCPDFYWQNGYGAFSVSPSNVEQVKLYIENQEEHHRKMTFQEEFREFLRRHEITWDERYVWD